MAEIASAFVSLLPSAKGFGRKLDSEISGDLDAAGKSGGKKFGAAFKVGAAAAVGGAVILGGFLKGAVGEAREAQKVGALTEQIIKSTGGAAKVTAKQVGDLATAISNKTGMDDEAIQSGANLLLTFKNVRNEVGKGNKIFDRATQAAADLSAAGFGDLNGASKQLGKALNDPVKGMTALSRSGVTFTEQQEKQIKALVKSGDALKAQKIILAEVESQVGGAAAASATAGEKAAVAFGNLKEQIGTAMLPAIDAAANLFTTKLAPAISSFVSGVGPALSSLRSFLSPIAQQLGSMFSGGAGGGFTASLSRVATAVRDNFLPVFRAWSNTLTTVVLPAVSQLWSYLSSRLGPVFAQVANIVATQVLPILSKIGVFIYGTVAPAIVKFAQNIGTKLKPVFDQLVETMQTTVLPAISKLLTKIEENWPTIKRVITVVGEWIGKAIELGVTFQAKVMPHLIRFGGWLIKYVIPAVVGTVVVVARIIAKLIEFGRAVAAAVQKAADFARGIKEKFGEAVDFVSGIPGKVKSALGDLGSLLYSAGQDAVQGLLNGIQSKIGQVSALAGSLGGLVASRVRGALDIRSPSRVMMRIGRYITEGLEVGIKKGEKRLARATTLAGGVITRALSKGLDGRRNLVKRATNQLHRLFDNLGKKGLEKLKPVLDDVRDRIKKFADTAAQALKDVRQQSKQFSSSVAGTFRNDVFGNGAAGLKLQLQADTNDAQAMLKALRKAEGKGLSGGLFKALAASGDLNTAQQLANMSRAQIAQYERMYAARNKATNQLGDMAAREIYGETIKELKAELREVRKVLNRLPEGVERGARKGVGDKDRETNQRRRARG